ncbi:hypothetical protein MMC30_000869 [Trapelia coarctata]|nr:hypothetical protein [Trapelia coarctata]
MDPWKSWTVVAIVGVGAYWYYTNQQKDKRGPTVVTQPVQPFRRKVEAKNKRKKDAASRAPDKAASDAATAASVSLPSSSGEQAKHRKGGKKKPANSAKSSAVDMTSEAPLVDGRGGDDEIDNKEFARQLTSVQTGTTLTNTGKAVKPPRTVKQSRLNGAGNGAPDPVLPDIKDLSGDSSTTGADADDDYSATNSPEFGATRRGEEGVSDMLEAPAPGPTVLRLTESTKPQRPSAPKQPKSTEAQESKKQRQRKAKKEAEKAALEQAEKERRVLMEKQMRTAREARGEPAKNGLPVSAPPKSNAWTKPTNGTDTGSTPVNEANRSPIPLLDTFDQAPKPVNGNQQNTAVKRDPESSVSDSKLSDLNWPSEEEQMRMLDEIEGSSSWQMVNGKKRRGSKKPESVKEAVAKSNAVQSGDVKSKVVESGDVTGHSVTSESVLSDQIPAVAIKKGGKKPADTKEQPKDAAEKPKDVAEHPEDLDENLKDVEQKSEDIEDKSKDIEKTKTATQQPRKPKKGEYLPYKDKPHPLDSDWRVV